jgi:uncharacterized protein (DUF1330 family)
MSAYVVVEVETHDQDLMVRYRELVAPTVQAHGGRFIVRGGAAETLEGGWEPQRIVIIEFPTVAAAKAWWASEEYAEPKAMRQRAGKTRMIVVRGVE